MTHVSPDRGTLYSVKPYFGEGRLLIAHRGGAERWPENTIVAFENAYRLGYRWIETDIQLSADGEIVIFHDETLERTTDGSGSLCRHTLQELRSLDAGHGFVRGGDRSRRGTGIRIPTLDEALALPTDLRFNLEMKGLDPRLPVALWEFIESRGIHERVLAASAHDVQTERFRRLAGDSVATSAGKLGILRFWLGVRSGLHRFVPTPFDVMQVPILQGRLRVVDQRFVDAAHGCGLGVHVWTINDPFEMRWLDGLGVDGIMTDRPEVMLHALQD